MKKEDTRERLVRRKYEATHKEERKRATEQFNTRLPRKDYEEICAFLEANYIRKIDLIYKGYEALREEVRMRDEKEKTE